MGKRVLIVGLDGATWDVLNPLMEQQRLPRLREVVEGGASGILHSTVPPITPAAWTTFLTGKQPGTHGIIDFERYEPKDHKLTLNSTIGLKHVKNIWQILSAKDYKVGSLNVPMTYPPVKVNGFAISGFETPGPQADFAYPPALKQEVLAQWADPTLQARWHRRWYGGMDVYRENIAYFSNSFHQGAAMTKFCAEKYGWDVMMVVFKMVDNLQHKAWRYIDSRWSDRNPAKRDEAFRCFDEMDKALGNLLDYAANNDASVMIVSDHGHGSLEGQIQPNRLLIDWGYLKLRPRAQGAARAKKIISRALGSKAYKVGKGDIFNDLAVDFTKTTACVMHAGMAGFVYLNLKGRQPTGIVEPEHYERMRDELRERFLGDECKMRDPQGNEVQLFTDAHKPEKLYECDRKNREWLPDLMLIPHRPLSVVRKVRGSSPIRWLPYRRIEGTHRPEGVVALLGNSIKKGAKIEMNMADCAPTVLAMAGCPVPSDMEGQVYEDAFENGLPFTVEQVESSSKQDQSENAYSDDDLAKVTARLTDLGYLQ